MTRQAFLGGAAIAALAFAFAAPALAVDGPPPPPKSRVSFAKGASSATIKGTLKGDATIDYLVNAAAGQTIEVKLEPGNTKGDFIVIPAGHHAGKQSFGLILQSRDAAPSPSCGSQAQLRHEGGQGRPQFQNRGFGADGFRCKP